MVTYFNKKDLVDFGNYLLSDKRKESVLNGIDEEEKDYVPANTAYMLKKVSHADIENFLEHIKKTD